jgi:hypothetical protein
MKSRLLYILILFGTAIPSIAADIKYPITEIPEELKKDVNAVVREDKMVYKIISKNSATLYSYYAVTIFNANAKRHARVSLDYDKLTKITKLNGSVYDANGILIKKLKSSEIYDHSAYDGVTLFSDNRIKSADLSQNTYPYTVVFECEKVFDFLYFIDGSVIVPGEKISVQQASYELIYPPALTPRYKTYNIDQKPIINNQNGLESMLWMFKNLKPIKFEPLGDYHDLIPQITAAPSQFEFDGYAGTMQTWDQLGQWIGTLNKGRNVLPEQTKEKVRQLTSTLKTTEEKSKAIYEFLQSKSRYVSIQLGIGGFQPFEASVVDKMGYGDCKALSNYTVALLAEAGIKSHYVLIKAGDNEEKIQEDFPSSQFNHAVVCVPNGKDTLWLECTSQTNPFGYPGRFTGDRKALAITDDGAKIVRTTVYTAEQNMQTRTADVFVDATGNAKATVKTTYSGLQYENDNLNFILDNQFDDQKKWLQKNMGIPSFDINAFSFVNRKNKIPSAVVNLDLKLNRLATVSGKRIFLTANLMNRTTFIPEKVENRKTKVVRRIAFIDSDTINYHLPEDIYPEFLPEAIKFSSRFGEYESTFKMDQGSLVYIRRIKMYNGEFPPESYQELIDFYRQINKADNSKIVFLTKT